jgi:hypothetical protein
VEFKSKRLLTVPVLKLVQDQARYVKITEAMHLGKPQKAKEGEKAKEPATLANCVNLEDGSLCLIIVSAVVKSVLDDEYPNGTYVGLCFKITKRGRNPGKQYNQFDIEEIEDPSVPVTLGAGGGVGRGAAVGGGRK